MSRGAEFLAALHERVAVGDGAMGTELHARGVPLTGCLEACNIRQPALVEAVHAAYVAAGVDLLQTNTFGANRFRLAAHGLADQVAELNTAGVALARAAAGDRVLVAGSIGPCGWEQPGHEPPDDGERTDAYAAQARALAAAGADLLLCETFVTIAEARLALGAVAGHGLPVVVNCVFTDGPGGGRTADGASPAEVLGRLQQAGAAVVGVNCGGSPRTELAAVRAYAAAAPRVPLAAYPNAGIPKLVDRRYVYGLDAQAQAARGRALAEAGAGLIGGCCGSTPAAMEAVVREVAGIRPGSAPAGAPPVPRRPTAALERPPTFLDVAPDSPVLVVQLEGPRAVDDSGVLAAARKLQPAAPVISLGDNPLGVPRMDNAALGLRIREATGLEPLIHVSGRDRNALALQSRLLGLHALGLRSLLLLTGDPAGGAAGGHSRSTEVYDVTVYGLLEMVAQLAAGVGPGGAPMAAPARFTAGVGFNPYSPVIAGAVRRLERKVALGAQFAAVQPVFTPDDARRCSEALAGIGVPLLLGVMPLVSSANAEFVHAQVPGIDVPEAVRARLAAAKPEAQAAEGLAIAREVAQAAAGTFAGLYIVPPFNRTAAALAICDAARNAWKAR